MCKQCQVGSDPQQKDRREAPGLIDIGTYEPQQVTGRIGYRRERYQRRSIAQRWEFRDARRRAGLDPDTRDGYARPVGRAWCGRARTFGSVSVKVEDYGDGARAHYSGTQHCGSVWACPVCAPIIRRERSEEITEGARRVMDAGGGAVMVTFTMRHERVDRLADLMAVMRDAYADMSRSRRFREWKEDSGFIGYILAQEITYGRHGWHPHRHVLMFFDHLISDAEARMMADELFAMWSHAVDRCGGRTVTRSAFDVRPVKSGSEQVAGYVTKVEKGIEGIGKEVSIADVKAGRAAGSIAPFQLLDVGTREAEALWCEYAAATRGRSAIRWSRGLRDALGMGVERTDEEIVEELDPLGDAVFLVAPEVYDATIARNPALACAVLERVEVGDVAGAAAMVGGIPVPVRSGGGYVPMLTAPPIAMAA